MRTATIAIERSFTFSGLSTQLETNVASYLIQLGYKVKNTSYVRGSSWGCLTSTNPKKWESIATIHIDSKTSKMTLFIKTKSIKTELEGTELASEYLNYEADSIIKACETNILDTSTIAQKYTDMNKEVTSGIWRLSIISIIVGITVSIVLEPFFPSQAGQIGIFVGIAAGYHASKKSWR